MADQSESAVTVQGGGVRSPLNRAVIVDAARELFGRRGYANTTIEDIADQLGVRKGAVYYHVPKKSDLLVDVIAGLLRPIAAHAEMVSAGDLPPGDKLDGVVANHVSRLLSNQAAATVFFEQQVDVPADGELVDLSERIDRAFDIILAAGVADGSFRDSPVTLLRMHVLALCNWPYRWYRPQGSLSAEDVVTSVQAHVQALVRPITAVPKRRSRP